MINSARRLVGLTGGIGTGKTTVSNYLATKYHLPVLDADIYARSAVAQDSPIFQRIFDRYGTKVQSPDATLDRSALGEIIFNNSLEKQWLEAQIHPVVRDRLTQELQHLNDTTIVLVIPLLFEAELTELVTEIWVVSCDRSLQIARLQERNGLTSQQAQVRINNQFPLDKKVALADVVLSNNADLPHLYQQIDEAII